MWAQSGDMGEKTRDQPFCRRVPSFSDDRGTFRALLQDSDMELRGLHQPWVLQNFSISRPGTLRGLHYQDPTWQAKLLTVLEGSIQDVVVDLRRDSPDYGRWTSFELEAGRLDQVFVPRGFAHGFLVTGSEPASLVYLADAPYRPEDERILAWNDAALDIAWSEKPKYLAPRDQGNR